MMPESLFSIEAEQAAIGAVLLDPDQFDNVAYHVETSDFFKPEFAKIFGAMAEIVASGQQAEIGLVADRLEQIDKSHDWWPELAQISRNTASSRNAAAYANKVRQYSKLRQMYWAAADIQTKLIDGSVLVEDRCESARIAMVELDSGERHGPVRASEALKDYYEHIERCHKSSGGITGLTTGFENIDARFGGLQAANFAVIAARPGMGKTVMGLNIARHVAFSLNKNVLYFSLEMAANELFGRLISDTGSIPYTAVKTAQFDADDIDYWPRFNAAFRRTHESPLYIDDQAGTSITEIVARSNRLHRKAPLSLIVVDHLHLVASDGESETSKVANVSKSLKRLAKSLDIPVLALCQLNRSCEGRPDKRPMMSDLRQSGSIEEDADMIGFIYRDAVYNEDTQYPYLAEIGWKKARSAETGTDWFNAQLGYQRFVSCDQPSDVVQFQSQLTRKKRVEL